MAYPDGIDLSENNSHKLVITAVVFLALSYTCVALRTYTRAFLIKAFQLDDWIMLVGLATFTLYAGFLFTGIDQGIGRHNAAIKDQDQLVRALKWQALAVGTYIIVMMFIKLSIGIFLLRIASQSAYIWILRISLVVVFIWSTVIFFWNLFQCDPIDKQWDWRIEHGRCVEPGAFVSAAYALSAMTILSDFLYALLPIPMLWKVRMTMQAKLTVILILSLGVFASVATLVRIRYLPGMANLEDVLYDGTDSMVWTIVEPGLAIIASSLATIRPLLRAMRIRGFESTGDSDKRSRDQAFDQNQLSVHSPRRMMPRSPYMLEDITLATTRPGGGVAGDMDKSEVCVIQGHMRGSVEGERSSDDRRPGSRWSEGPTEDDSRSLVQFHDLEEQDQEDGLKVAGDGDMKGRSGRK